MTKKIKIIDILCYLSIGEFDKLPKRIRYRYGYLYKDFTFDGESLNYISDKDILFGEDITAMLNDEVEILDEEDEFEDIDYITCEGEKIELGKLTKYLGSPLTVNEAKICSAIECLGIELNQLVKNQKKIIERIKEEGK